jgi:predicted small lipoprotein YifL
MRTLIAAVLLAALALALAGCPGEPKGKKTPLELKDVPADILKVAKEKLPGVTFDAVYREPNGSYELRGKDRTGKVREIDIRPDGTVEEIQ